MSTCFTVLHDYVFEKHLYTCFFLFHIGQPNIKLQIALKS